MSTKRCTDCVHVYRQTDGCIGCDIEPHRQHDAPSARALAERVRVFLVDNYPAHDHRDFDMSACPGFVAWRKADR